MPGLLSAFSASPGIAAANKAKKATLKFARKGAAKQLGAYRESVGKQREALAPAITSVGEYLKSQVGDYGDFRDIQRSAYGVDDPALAEAAYRRSLQPGQHLSNENILRLSNQGVRSGGTLLDLQQHAFDTQYNPWRTGIEAGTKQFDPYQAIALQGTLGQGLSNVEGQFGANTANVFGNKFNALGQAKSQFETDKFGAQQGALANQWGAINAGVGLGSKLLGIGFA